MNKKEEAKKGCLKVIIALFVVMPISILLSGYTIRYGWNNLLVTINGIPKINLIQAMAIDTVISFIVASPRENKPLLETVVYTILTPILFLGILFVLTLFV
ncbi:phage membrane protein [Streptococcus pseudoporcinus]|uniref:Phage membrane protein n=1 Tax=Streptococcus pseudoporcinus TaxID=361101 RepID=A0A4U9XL44_9STRE|nr:hypothetical protein [Streptococcus pseudoporcinus]VTS14074.1 phage membrane protein [Streptococcus pseudoporcinus]